MGCDPCRSNQHVLRNHGHHDPLGHDDHHTYMNYAKVVSDGGHRDYRELHHTNYQPSHFGD